MTVHPKTSGLLCTAVLVAAGLLAGTPSYAAGETCQGRPATIVGSGGLVRGTEGPDVVVTNGVPHVMTLGGDDLVCVTGGVAAGQTTSVETGDGNDVVDAGAATGPTYAQLGAGRDSYTGSAQADHVEGGDLDARAIYVDAEADTITTGTGADRVLTGSSGVTPNADVVSVGADEADVTWFGVMTDGARLTGGGSSRLALRVGAGDVEVDAAAGTLAEDGRTSLRWTGFDDFHVLPLVRRPRAFTFVGSGRAEELTTFVGGVRQHIDLGGGADRLVVEWTAYVGGPRSSYDGGPGRDSLALWAGRSLDLDLASGRMVTRRSGRAVRATLEGFDSTFVVAEKLDLRGTRRADDLRFQACTATVRGRAGADVIAQNRYGTTFPTRLRCDRRSFRLYGDGGRDVLRGSSGNDVLIGGRGRDNVQGNAGRDRCSGEKLRACEIKLR